MIGKLIVSIDCEGKWGIADRATSRLNAIDTPNLERVYRQILQILDKHDAKATFGFVAALCLSAEELMHAVQSFQDVMKYGDLDWLAAPKRDLNAGVFSGWSAPSLIETVNSAGRHHICSHGGFHIPYSEKNVHLSAIKADLQLIKEFRARQGGGIDTLIFPRNVIGYQAELYAAGFRGYRDIDVRERTVGVLGKAQRLLNEVVSFDRNDYQNFSYRQCENLLVLSPGKFLNARIGIRKFVTPECTFRRIDHMLDVAVKNARTLHFYTHPHNFIADPTMVQKFDYLFERANAFAERGMLKICTMRDELHEAAGER